MSGEFTRDAPDRVWVADVTQHRTGEGWVYLSVVIDAFHRRVVGWAMDDVLNTDLATLQTKLLDRRLGSR